MDRKLYVERWLLTVKQALVGAGLDASVRAVDRKGGRLLALEVRQGPGALELRYRKRRLGPRVVAAATSIEILAPVRRVLEKVLAEHSKLLENGFRRFLRRSLQVVQALETAFAKDPGMLERVATALGRQATAFQPALALQPGKRGEFQTHAAVARRRAGTRMGLDFYVWDMQRLLDLTYLLPGQRGAPAGSMESLVLAGAPDRDPVELRLPNEDAAAPSASGQADDRRARSDIGDVVADVAVNGAGEVAVGAIEHFAAPRVAADAAGAGLDGLGAAADALGGLGGAAADAAGGAVEVVSGAASCLEGADCSGIDLGGCDCSFG